MPSKAATFRPTHERRESSSAADKFRNTYRWQQFREWFGKHQPLCFDPFYFHARSGVVQVKELVHHIKPVAKFIELGLVAENCASLCNSCHARIEKMEVNGEPTEQLFKKGKITIVCGAPGSGKSTYVKQNMAKGDLVIDLDAIAAAFSLSGEVQRHHDSVLPFLLCTRDAVYGMLKSNGIRACNAWIVASLPSRSERESLASSLNASIVLMQATRAECLSRIRADSTRTTISNEQWQAMIDRWFSEYD